MHNDLTFFTNAPNNTLLDRFNKILKSNTKFFDVLVGYFRTSGFYKMYPAMEGIEKIRILVGLNVDRQTVELIQQSKEESIHFQFSHKEVKEEYRKNVQKELEQSEDSKDVELGIKAFIDYIQSGKMEMRIYTHAPIHAKVYIMRKDLEKSPDYFGSVITGSSNFSAAGLQNNLEFNVELKDSRDVQYALDKFETLWEESIAISDEYIETIYKDTWIREDITPYELFIKCLYEYFKEELNEDKMIIGEQALPDEFMPLQYQVDAVNRSKKILDAYNGVFISDVVGLGKTYICALLAQKLRGKKLFICPPVLQSYWQEVLLDFDVAATVESLGKLDRLIENGIDDYKYVFIDEAHRFRNQGTESFKKLHNICVNKKIILISATPQNNYSSDIANQIFLFQPRNNSTIIPNQKNIEAYFNKLNIELRKLDPGTPKYQAKLRNNSQKIRDDVLRNVMVRRTRKEIVKYYKKDLEQQGLSFPELTTPQRIIYEFDNNIGTIFNSTIQAITDLDYARYKPLTFLKEITNEIATMIVGQRNMRGFMKSLLIKRLESSFYAFKGTLRRFVNSYEKFIQMCEQGEVYISKKVDVYDLLDNGDDEKLWSLTEDDIVQHFSVNDFDDLFLPALKKDYAILKKLQDAWDTVIIDPKLDQFKSELKNNPVLKGKKLIIFTESKETAEYLGRHIEQEYPGQGIVYTGESKQVLKKKIESNYNPRVNKPEQQDDIQYLITTDVLAEGINLHRSNVIINYDLPWNPTKIMQRVGRINRVGTEHDRIYVFNFFPTAQSSDHLSLEQNIIAKIQAFHDTLGEDFKYLTEDEEVVSHHLFGEELYNKMMSKESLEEEEEDINPELKYQQLIREIRDNNPDLFEKIKRLPKKARSGRVNPIIDGVGTISFLRKGSLKKFFISDQQKDAEELYFHQAIKYFECQETEKRLTISDIYFQHLNTNKEAFEWATTEGDIPEETNKRGKQDASVIKLLKALGKCKVFTDVQDEEIKKLRILWEEGIIPTTVTKEVLKRTKELEDPLHVYYTIEECVPLQYLNYNDKKSEITKSDNEVILSLYMEKEE